MTTPQHLIDRLRDLTATLDKLGIAEGNWPTDRNRRLKAGHEMRASLRTFNAAPKVDASPEQPAVELTETHQLEATRVYFALQKLQQNERAQDLKALLATAVGITKELAGDAATTELVAATETASKATDGKQRSVAQRAEAIQQRAQNTRRPVRRGLV